MTRSYSGFIRDNNLSPFNEYNNHLSNINIGSFKNNTGFNILEA